MIATAGAKAAPAQLLHRSRRSRRRGDTLRRVGLRVIAKSGAKAAAMRSSHQSQRSCWPTASATFLSDGR